MRTFATILVLLGAFLSAPARADLTICNEFDETVFVAAGSQRNNVVWTMGWWEVAPGQCHTINSGHVISPTYVHVETESKDLPGDRSFSVTWGTGRKLVVGTTKFERQNADQPLPGDRIAEFTDVTERLIGSFAGFTYYVRKQPSIQYRCHPGEHVVLHFSVGSAELIECAK
jgi:hypothetical protein